ncbi:hypothetical protein BCR34DRAFT_555359 [Clohesyomyces aquaticus]|uniref:Uncharacterized protein n=1 Tax=Clohesyomyces aquaticus TaxID=1231657 RepID=A0A1Y2A4G0_9PLEO|nr:hypothetical protein BCR34DRAFT_555359 [Clohesyomyces aquaticus]
MILIPSRQHHLVRKKTRPYLLPTMADPCPLQHEHHLISEQLGPQPSHDHIPSSPPLPPPPPPPNSEEAAAILFCKSYHHYILWQTDILNADLAKKYGPRLAASMLEGLGEIDPPGQFPDRRNYLEFKEWLWKQGLAFGKKPDTEDEGHVEEHTSCVEWEQVHPICSLNLARDCRHPLYPSFPMQRLIACPVCELRECLKYLRRAAKLWDMLGGPYRNRRLADQDQTSLLAKIKSVYGSEKTRLVNLVDSFEDSAKREAGWEQALLFDSPRIFPDLPDAQPWSATRALQIAKTCSLPYTYEGGDVVFVPKRRNEKPRKKSRITFTANIPQNNERQLAEFCRESPQYNPGRHACPSKDGWEDTSFWNEEEYGEVPVVDKVLAGLFASTSGERTHEFVRRLRRKVEGYGYDPDDLSSSDESSSEEEGDEVRGQLSNALASIREMSAELEGMDDDEDMAEGKKKRAP